jgi:hypothetical protein
VGFKRVLGSGIVGILIFIPMAYISFAALDLVGQVTDGLITNVAGLEALLPGNLKWVMVLVGGIAGVFLVNLFPLHWALMNNPGDIMLMLALILPWILTGIIIAAIFAHSPTGGFTSCLAVGIGYFTFMAIIYGGASLLGGQIPIPISVTGLLDDITAGLTGLPFLAATASAAFEGAAVGGIFGAFIGSLKYEGEGGGSSSKKKKDKKDLKEPTWKPSSKSSPSKEVSKGRFCTNCGAKIVSGDEFCTNCGSKAKS